MRVYRHARGVVMRVLVCDAQAKQATAVVRDLRDAGHEVVAASAAPWLSAACWSRGCQRRRAPSSDANDFIAKLIAISEDTKSSVLLPLKDRVTYLAAVHQNDLGPLRTCLAPGDLMERVSHKAEVQALAEAAGIASPRTWHCSRDMDVRAVANDVVYPAVVKPAHGSGILQYINSRAELEQIARRWLPSYGALVIQEYVAGEGVGFFALYLEGRCLVWYTHRRLREYPSTGGISISAESTRDEELAEAGTRLLDGLQWHGPAMVECKRETGTGRLVLIEVNTKLWGSLDLALACGLHFPRWVVALAAGESINAPHSYPVGVRMHWPAPAAMAQALTSWSAMRALIRDVRDPSVGSDWRWDDPLPNVVQLAQVPGYLWMTRGRWRAPHGRPVGTGPRRE